MKVMAYHPTSFFLPFQLARNILTNNSSLAEEGGWKTFVSFSPYGITVLQTWCDCKFSSRHGFGVTVLLAPVLLVRSQCTLFLGGVFSCAPIFFFTKGQNMPCQFDPGQYGAFRICLMICGYRLYAP